MSVRDLARPEVRAFQPYVSARSESPVAAAVMLNANESPWPHAWHPALNRYPEPQPRALCERLADHAGVAPDQVLLGRGSDEAIDLLLRGFCRPGLDAVVVCPPTFGMYAVSARLQGADVIEVPLAGARFEPDPKAILAACSPAVKIVFLCSPNNPTGNSVPLDAVEHVADALRDRALVIVDEAYVEFASTPSAAGRLTQHDNLGVLRTLSKAWGLAGARVGALLANREIVDLLRSIMAPYPLPVPSIEAALTAFEPEGRRRMREHVDILVEEREHLRKALQGAPGVREILPSQANFLTVRFEAVDAVRGRLADHGIVVRDITRYPGLADALRISIGTPEQNRRLLDVLAATRNGSAA